jgi:hypothetical protein
MKHIVLIGDDELFRELEAAAAVKDVLIEQMTEELLKIGIAAKQSSLQGEKRPSAAWPPEIERRTRA